ncbi:hypothetical protein B0H14DRAFT_2649504 [Mycena olivaceomarginata]|nr:hypothetical protein B0H14DRAFT_2649504 [Mycena olivaceomarginata]
MLEEVADEVLHHFGIQPSLGSPSESAVTGPVKITEPCRLPAEANSLRTGVADCTHIPPVLRDGESKSIATKALSDKERDTRPLHKIVIDKDWLDTLLGSEYIQTRLDNPYRPKQSHMKLYSHLVTDRWQPQLPEPPVQHSVNGAGHPSSKIVPR